MFLALCPPPKPDNTLYSIPPPSLTANDFDWFVTGEEGLISIIMNIIQKIRKYLAI